MVSETRPPALVYAENPRTRRLRRIVDRTLSGVLMAVASPVVGIACLAIYLEDRGPVGRLLAVGHVKKIEGRDVHPTLGPRRCARDQPRMLLPRTRAMCEHDDRASFLSAIPGEHSY